MGSARFSLSGSHIAKHLLPLVQYCLQFSENSLESTLSWDIFGNMQLLQLWDSPSSEPRVNMIPTQWRSQAGAHWGMCPSNWRLCPTSADAPENYRCWMSIANWALKVRKGVEIELRSLAICIFRITRFLCSPDFDVCVCHKYYSDLTLCALRFVAKALLKCSNSRQQYGLK